MIDDYEDNQRALDRVGLGDCVNRWNSNRFAEYVRKVSDFDGDGRADFAVTRDESGRKIWYVWQSTAGFKVFHWGISTDISAAGDYNADGITDFAVFRGPNSFPTVYTFHILESGSNIYVEKTFTSFANFGSNVVQQDYNGDGSVDAALNYGEFGFATQLQIQFSGPAAGGTSESVPARQLPLRLGDLDGDGRSDLAHYHIDTFLVTMTNLNTRATRTAQFGVSGDRYVMADFDGDGIGDLTVFRRSTGDWWWIRSSDGQARAAQWGVNGDVPVPADYDGDGKTDLAIWRPGSPQSNFWVLGSQDGVTVFPWGVSSDQPVRY